MTPIDAAYRRARQGDHDGFADWVRLAERPLRTALRSFARVVDVEAIVQEGLLRMWVLAPTIALEGENASLRYVTRLARNLAVREAERMGIFVSMDRDDPAGHEPEVAPGPISDPGLRRAIQDCLKRLPAKPGRALAARLRGQGSLPDRDLASGVRMTLNTFLQNVVRARKHMAECLESKGVALGGSRP